MNQTPSSIPSHSEHKASELHLRPATTADLNDLTSLAQASFPDDPEWNYRFPYRNTYPEDNWKWTRREYEEYLAQPEKYAVMVVTTTPLMEIEDGNVVVDKIAALAVWDVSVLTKTNGGDSGIHERRDVNSAHMTEFADTLSAAYDKYFSGYGGKQIHLWLLTTHPDFRRRGAGTMLYNWGFDRAAEKGWVVTVLASPLGKLLYERLGCKLLGSVTVQGKS